MRYISYTEEIENYLKSSKFNHKQHNLSYWRREMIRIDCDNIEYSFIPFESAPFNPIVSFNEFIELIK